LSFFWCQGGDNYELEESLHLGSGYPSLIALSFSKSKSTTMKFAYSKENIEDFTARVVSGREPFVSFDAELI